MAESTLRVSRGRPVSNTPTFSTREFFFSRKASLEKPLDIPRKDRSEVTQNIINKQREIRKLLKPAAKSSASDDPGESNPETTILARKASSYQAFIDRYRNASVATPILCGSLADWKKRKNIPDSVKVFIIKGGYEDMKRSLELRGWAENTDTESPCFDFKWTLSAKDIQYDKLLDNQMVNHFFKNREITTKVGLTSNLKASQENAETYYPQTFHLGDATELADFASYFKFNKAISILKSFIARKVGTNYSYAIVAMCLSIAKRSLADVDDELECTSGLSQDMGAVTLSEWAVLRTVSLADPTRQIDDGELSMAKSTRITKPAECAMSSDDLHAQVEAVLNQMRSKSPQYSLNGMRNMWIIKPSGKSRGRGVEVKRNLSEIAASIKACPEGETLICQKYIENPQVIHGYKFDIRVWVLVTNWNPLTVYIWRQPYVRFASEKFDPEYKDISAYVHLVNNSINKNNPTFNARNEELKVDDYMWFRQDYEKWLHQTYCTKQKHNTPWLHEPPFTAESMGFDINVALSGKYGIDYHRPQTQPIPQSPQCDQCEDLWSTTIKPQIKDIVVSSLWSVVDSVEHRTGSSELFGYDFMVSDDNKVWLIEVNSSPAMDYSTHVTAPLIKLVMEDTVRVLIDLPKVSRADPGEWELAYQSEITVQRPPVHPRNLEISGKSMRKPVPVVNLRH